MNFQDYWDEQIDRLEVKVCSPLMNILYDECRKAYEFARNEEDIKHYEIKTKEEIMKTYHVYAHEFREFRGMHEFYVNENLVFGIQSKDLYMIKQVF